MSTDSIARQPAGAPVGGQFATTAHPEADVTIDTPAAAMGNPGEALAAAVARMREDRQTVVDTATHLIAVAILKAEPDAAYLELEGVESGGGIRVYPCSVLGADGEVLHDNVEEIEPTDGSVPGLVYDEVSELTSYYESEENAAWCDAVSDPNERPDGVLTHNPNFVIDLHAAKALYPEGPAA